MKKILYLSFSDTNSSANAVYIKGLRANGVAVLDYFSKRGRVGKYADVTKFFWRNRKGSDSIVVGIYDSPGLAIWLKIISDKKIIYYALCSVYERMVISRGVVSGKLPKAFFYWLLDFIASHMVDLVMLETEKQIKYFCKKFFLSSKKCFRAWTGVDEENFFYDPNLNKFENFTVIFRGAFLPEAGVDYVVKAAKKLENNNIDFYILGSGQEDDIVKKIARELNPKNLKIISERLPIEEVRILMQKCYLSLGQLSDHERLERTVPHKAFESMVLKIPYLTANNTGILELLKENETCIVCKSSDAEDLSQKILWAKSNSEEIKRIAENAYQLFCVNLTMKKLSANLLGVLRNLETGR